MKSLDNKTALIFDLFFCLALMPLLMLLGPMRYWLLEWPDFSVLAVAYLYACYFVMKYLKMPKLILHKQYLRIAAIVLGLIVCTYLVSCYHLPELDFVTPYMSRYQTMLRDYNVSISLWMMFSVVVCYALTTAFVKELYEQQLLKKKIENQRDKAELAMFKARISPHFMFNTLNSLYSLVIGTSQKAEDAFVKFTEILKYTYVTLENESVPLKDEIVYIGNYIDLQKIRLNDCTEVVWDCDVDDDATPLPPLLLLTFVENAFKYGTSTSRKCSVLIRLHLRDGRLLFETRNRVMKHAGEFRDEVSIGIANCRARLAGIFPGRHVFEATERDGVFDVRLEINLNQK
ncbi:MAG: histidine kinase [Muribaculaceae bacterium]|nr:histidine kinase [Muribaculaceae bacterium]